LEEAVFEVKPSNLKDLVIEIPKTLWEDIGGNDDVKQLISQCVEWPLKHPEAFQRIGIKPPQGILLYGPPGCSKTMTAKALATESGLNFMAIKGPELFNKYVGETEKSIREIFRKARISAPCIIFFDEIDAMAMQRGSGEDGNNVSDRILCQLLNEIDGVESNSQVIIIGATNRPDCLDKALLRPGRFDRLVHMPEPDKPARLDIFKIYTKKMALAKDVVLEELAELTDSYTGAEISLVCREAGMLCLAENINATEVCNSNFIRALKTVRPRLSKETRDFYINFSNKMKTI